MLGRRQTIFLICMMILCVSLPGIMENVMEFYYHFCGNHVISILVDMSPRIAPE